jgi:hypothetical protein
MAAVRVRPDGLRPGAVIGQRTGAVAGLSPSAEADPARHGRPMA